MSTTPWGPGPDGDRAFELVIDYEVRTDALVSYRSGFRREVAQRPTALTVYSHGQELRRYDLTYDPGSPITRLQSITRQHRKHRQFRLLDREIEAA